MLLVNEGNRDEAVRTALIIFRLAHHLERNPTFINYLVVLTAQGIATESTNAALQAGPVSKEVHDALDAELALQERMGGYTWAIKSERAFGLDSFRNFPMRNFWLFYRARFNRWESEYLDEMQAFLALTHGSSPYQEAERAIRRIQAKSSSTMAKLVGAPMQSIQQAVTRTRAIIRSLRVLNAIQAHVPAGSNETPKLSGAWLAGRDDHRSVYRRAVAR